MTIADLIYIIGGSFAFLLSFTSFISEVKETEDLLVVILGSLFLSIFSWGFVLFYFFWSWKDKK